MKTILNKLIKATQETLFEAEKFLFAGDVKRGGAYSKLFSHLSERDSLLEFRFTKPGRVFYYIENDIIYIVATRREHL